MNLGQSSLPRVKRKSQYEHDQCHYNTGRWSDEERLLFLKGLRAYGWGQWKEIGGTYLTTRSCSQIKSHAHKCRARLQQGHTLLETLDKAERQGLAPPTPDHVLQRRQRINCQYLISEATCAAQRITALTTLGTTISDHGEQTHPTETKYSTSNEDLNAAESLIHLHVEGLTVAKKKTKY